MAALRRKRARFQTSERAAERFVRLHAFGNFIAGVIAEQDELAAKGLSVDERGRRLMEHVEETDVEPLVDRSRRVFDETARFLDEVETLNSAKLFAREAGALELARETRTPLSEAGAAPETPERQAVAGARRAHEEKPRVERLSFDLMGLRYEGPVWMFALLIGAFALVAALALGGVALALMDLAYDWGVLAPLLERWSAPSGD